MSQLADIQDLTRQWKQTYNWSEAEHIKNYRDILDCLEWDACWEQYPKDADGRTDWNKREEMDQAAAKKSLGYDND